MKTMLKIYKIDGFIRGFGFNLTKFGEQLNINIKNNYYGF